MYLIFRYEWYLQQVKNYRNYKFCIKKEQVNKAKDKVDVEPEDKASEGEPVKIEINNSF